MSLTPVVVAVGWPGAARGHTPTGTEATSALVAVLVTLGVLLWGRGILRRRAEKIIPFRRN